MKIVDVETFVLNNRRMLVKVSTDEGVAGWGEPILENWALTCEQAVLRMRELLVGQDPLQITRLWQILARGGFYRGGPIFGSAVAGLDQALWDLKGRWLGVPIHDLLGGTVRDRMRVYAHGGGEFRAGDPERVRALVVDGYTLIKIAPPGPRGFIDTPAALGAFVDQFAELRDIVGPEVDLAIDAHGRLSISGVIRLLAELEPLRPAFVEEPLRPEHSARIADVVRSTSVPIATGERLFDRYEFRTVLESGIAIAQPDPSHAFGITECFRIATQAEIYDVQIAPHCPLGPVSLATCLQLDFAVPNAYVQEMTVDLSEGSIDRDILLNPEVLDVVDGHIARLTGPGLGVDIDEDAVRSRVAAGALDPGSPMWFAADGSFAEW